MTSGRGGARTGAGRKKGSGSGEGLSTHVIRVPLDVSKDDACAIPSIRAVAEHWRAECDANPKGARYYFLKQMLDELDALGI